MVFRKHKCQRGTLIMFLLFSLSSFSQTGPAGVLGSVNNVLWLKADSGSYSDAGITLVTAGGAIRRWNDESGNGKNADQATTNLRPTWQTNVFNGHSVARFDGSNDGILSTGLTTGNAASVWAVFKYASLGSSNPGVLQGSPTGLGFSATSGNKVIGLWVSQATSQVWGRGIQSNNTQCNISQVTALAANTGYLVANRYNGAGTINQYVNNAASGNVAYNSTLLSWTDFGLGQQGGETLNGDIAEVIVYNASVNEAQRHIIDNYLSARYNIALSSNDLYAGDNAGNGDYDFDVAGIGKDATGANLTASASATGGLEIQQATVQENGEYLLWGHQTGINSINFADVGGMSAGANKARWNRIWYLDFTHVGGTTETFNLIFDYSDGGTNGVPVAPTTNYKLLYRAGLAGNWTEVMNASSIATDRVTFNGVAYNWTATPDGYYTIGTLDNAGSPLPVELASFDASACDGKVCLDWTTLMEKSSDYFSVERSVDGIRFSEITKVKGAGSSSQTKKYAFMDENPFHGISYYRLKQMDIDKSFVYSEIKAVDLSISNYSILIYPNPCQHVLNILLKKNNPVIVKITDALGVEVIRTENNVNKNTNNLSVDLSSVESGVYVVTIISDSEIFSQKFTKQ